MAKKILYVQTSGPDTPERLYAPFVLATTAKAMGIDATVYFLAKGILGIKKGEPQKIKMGNFPSLKEVMDQAAKAGVDMLIFSGYKLPADKIEEAATALYEAVQNGEISEARINRSVLKIIKLKERMI